MLEDIFQRINSYRKKNLRLLLLFSFFNTALIVFFIYQVANNQRTTALTLAIFITIALDYLLLLVIVLVNYNKARKIQQNEITPYLIRNVNNNWKLTEDVFKKEEELNSLIINRYGSFKSLKIVRGMEQDIPFSFGYVTNVVSAGQTSNDVFSGTYFSFQLPMKYSGIIQLRDRGRPSKYKRLNLVCIKYDSKVTEPFKEIKCYTNNSLLADKLITYEFIQFYLGLKRDFKKGFYLSLIDNKLVIGIHNRKNYLSFSMFEKINQENFNQKVEQLRKLEVLIRKTCQLINVKERG